MGDALDTPEQMVRGDLRWAITHGMTERVRLFVEHGVDIVSPFGDGITPAERAATTGHPELVRYLVACGAPAPDLSPEQRFVAAALAADQATVTGLRAAHPGLADAVREARPSLIVWAAATDSPLVDCSPGSASTSTPRAVGRPPTRGRPRCTSPRWKATSTWPGACSGSAPTPISATTASAPPRSAGLAISAQEQLIELLEPLTAPDAARGRCRGTRPLITRRPDG